MNKFHYTHVFPEDSRELHDVYLYWKRMCLTNQEISVCSRKEFDPKILGNYWNYVIFWKGIPDYVPISRKAFVAVVLVDDLHARSDNPESARMYSEFWSKASYANMVFSSYQMPTHFFDPRLTGHCCVPLHFYNQSLMGAPARVSSAQKPIHLLTVGDRRSARVSRILGKIQSCFGSKHAHVDFSWDPYFRQLANSSRITYPIRQGTRGQSLHHSFQFGVIDRAASTSSLLMIDESVDDASISDVDIYRVGYRDEGELVNNLSILAAQSDQLSSAYRKVAIRLGDPESAFRRWSQMRSEMSGKDRRMEKSADQSSQEDPSSAGGVSNWNFSLTEANLYENDDVDDDGGNGDDEGTDDP